MIGTPVILLTHSQGGWFGWNIADERPELVHTIVTLEPAAPPIRGVNTSTATEYAILSNYPNPFNPSTTVNYELFTEGFVDLAVYNVVAQEVASLVNGVIGFGQHSAVWNGLDASGNEVKIKIAGE